MVVLHHQLRIHEDIAAEDERRDDTIDELDRLAAGEEGRHEAEDDEHPQRAEKIRHPGRKVVLGLAREEREREEDPQREDQGLDDNPTIVEGGDDADAVGLEGGEAAQKKQVGGVGLALPEGEEHEGDGAEEGAPHHPVVGLDPCLVALAEEGDGGEDGGEEELDGQDAVDFADELHADGEGGFGDGAAELGERS